MKGLCLALAAVLVARSASADGNPDDEKRACFRAVDEAQRLKIGHKLLEAREQFRVCARATCPVLFRNDCASWLAEVEAALPSVVFGAKDAQGQDLIDVHVSMDGRTLIDKLEGTSVGVDPGPHRFRFEWLGHGAVEQQVVIHEGEKDRLVSITFPSSPVTTLALPDAKRASAPIPPGVWVLGALGVAGGAAFTALFTSAASDVTALRASSCAPACPSSDLDGPRLKATVAYISLGAGIAAAGGAITWYVLSRSPKREASVSIEPALGGGKASLTLRY